MLDLLLKGARLPGELETRDIGIKGGLISELEPEAHHAIDLAGALVTPALVEPHIHLDAVLTEGEPRHNDTGCLFEGIAIWAERLKTLTVEDVKQRARRVLRWQLANGVQFVRSHVDVCDPELRAVRAMVDLRKEIGDQITLQLVAFPQQGILSFDGGQDLMRRAVDLGVDVVGAIPHFELTREYGELSIKFAFDLAANKGLRVDIHCDETDDDQSRFVEVMAAETIRLGMGGRVTASHTTAMHSYNNAYAYKLINNLKRAQMHMVTNPLDNSTLQGRFDSYPIRRGHTRVKELLAAGINVVICLNSVMDPWYPLGYGDPLQSAFVLAHYGQMSGHGQLRTLMDMITWNPASALGLTDYGLEPGCLADLVIFDAPSEMDAIRLVAPRRAVIRAGEIVARTTPAQHFVRWDGADEAVDFLRPS